MMWYSGLLILFMFSRERFFSCVADSLLNNLVQCSNDQIKHIYDKDNTIEDMAWCRDKLRQGGWENGKLMKNVRVRVDYKNLGCGYGLNTSCDQRFGDQFVLDWRKHRLATGCYHRSDNPNMTSVQCYEHDGTRKKICSVRNAILDFRKLSLSQDKLPRRLVDKGFIFLNCMEDDPFIDTTAMEGYVLQRRGSADSPSCDLTIEEGDVYLLNADNIDNIGHTLSDFLNMWLAILVSNRARDAKRNMNVLIVDQLYRGKGHFRHDVSPLGFFQHLTPSFNSTLTATQLTDRVVCVKEDILMFNSNRDMYPFIFEGAPFNLQCSYKGEWGMGGHVLCT